MVIRRLAEVMAAVIPLFVVLALPFVLLGSVAPTPAWPQYFYAVVPLLILLAGVAWLQRSVIGRFRTLEATAKEIRRDVNSSI